jgi:hypothetical protein
MNSSQINAKNPQSAFIVTPDTSPRASPIPFDDNNISSLELQSPLPSSTLNPPENENERGFASDQPSSKKRPREDNTNTTKMKLYCNNLPSNATNRLLREAFSSFGPVSSAHVTNNKRGKFGLITVAFRDTADFDKISKEGLIISGIKIKVSQAALPKGKASPQSNPAKKFNANAANTARSIVPGACLIVIDQLQIVFISSISNVRLVCQMLIAALSPYATLASTVTR